MLATFSPHRARLPDGRAVVIRPARPADAAAVQAFVRWLSPLARRRRFLGALRELSPAQLDRLTRVEDPRELTLLALAGDGADATVVAMAQYALDDPSSAEFALVVADAWQGQGLGVRLLERMLARATAAGVRKMGGIVLADNAPMRALARRLGFDSAPDRDPLLVRVEKDLPARAPGAAPLALRVRSLRWWYWLATALLLAAALLGWPAGLPVTMGFVAVQAAYYVAREGALHAFPAQTRVAFLGLLAAGTWPPLAFLHWLQLAGTCASVAFDYCLLARAVSLLPWNRTGPFGLRRAWRTFASPPLRGSALGAVR